METAWQHVLGRSNLLIPLHGIGRKRSYSRLALSFARKFRLGPFDLVHQKKGSYRYETKRVISFFKFVAMKPGHRARFLSTLMELGVECGRWKVAPLSDRVQIRLWTE